MSFYDELKRRNVVKTAVLYGVASWLILQVADVLFDAMELPAVWVRLVLALLILGFPLALVFSWVYEMTPEGLKREKDVDRSRSATSATGRKIDILIIAMLALAIGAVILDQLVGQVSAFVLIGAIVLLVVAAFLLVRIVPPADPTPTLDETISATAAPPRSPATDSPNTIAVLPFVNMSSDEEQEYFSDGLSEELLNLLTRIPELRVAARTSSFSFKGKDVKVAQIGAELNVAYVLEGSVRKSGNRVRITAQLIQAENGYHLWSDTFDRTLDDVFVIQDEIAAKVVAQLKIKLLSAVPVVNETDPEAYALFLQARHLGRQGTAEAFEQSIALYKQALVIDPAYVAAWDGIAAVYCDQADKGQRPIDEGYSLAREAVNKALVIEPGFAKGHARLGWIANSYEGDLAVAARHLDRALELDATDLDILDDAAVLAASLGHLGEAIALQEYVLARDPLNVKCHRRMGLSYLFIGCWDDAIASFRTAWTLSPGMLGAQQLLGIALLLKDEPQAALAAIQKEVGSWRQVGLIMAHHALGQATESDAALAKAIEVAEQTAAYNIAFTLAFRGEADRAFEWLDKAVQYKDPGLTQITNMPLFANIHGDPRWLPFLEKLGRSPKQLASIEFEIKPPDYGKAIC
jgi:TolB-like protein/Flp pilus assembly protein TadD